MWPWIKRWRDWAMRELWTLPRTSLQSQAYYSFEKAGLTLHDQPIPWNAEAVVVEALVSRVPADGRRKSDFTLHVDGREPVPVEYLRAQDDKTRLFFRLLPPPKSTSAEIRWRERRLGQLTLPVLGQEEFLENLRLNLPTLFVRLGEQNVACQTFVATQCRGLLASGILASPTSLVPLLDLGLQVEFRSERGAVQRLPMSLCGSQLAEKQALVTVAPRQSPRRIGTWSATWYAGDRPLASQTIRAISQRDFQKSLRLADTRFVAQTLDGTVLVSRQAPLPDSIRRGGPCFLVRSSEPGMAGICPLRIEAQASDGTCPVELPEQEVLITDGPTVVAPGTLSAADLARVHLFELKLKNASLGTLPLSPVPAAAFTSEGGFKGPLDFSWSLSAEEQLNDRLTKLIEGAGRDAE